MKRTSKFLAIVIFLLLLSLCPSQIQSEDNNQSFDNKFQTNQDEKLSSQDANAFVEESKSEEEFHEDIFPEQESELEEKNIEDFEKNDDKGSEEKTKVEDRDHEESESKPVEETLEDFEKNDNNVIKDTVEKEKLIKEDQSDQKEDEIQENASVQARSTRISSEGELVSRITKNYNGRIRGFVGLGSFDFGKLMNTRETASIPQLGILRNRPLYIDYIGGKFDLDGAFETKAYTLSDKKSVWNGVSYLISESPVVGNHRIYQGLDLYIQAYDREGRTIKAVEDESQDLFLKTSFSGRAMSTGVFAINKQNLSLYYGNRYGPQKTENKENIRRFLSAHMMRASIHGHLSAHVTSFFNQRRLALAIEYSYGNLINTENIGGGRIYEADYGRDLKNYVQFRKVEQDAEFTRAPQSHLSFEDGQYHLNSDIGLRSSEIDWMLVAVNYPGKSLEGEDCDCDWVRYYNLTDAYREKIQSGQESFDIDLKAKLGNVTPEKNHAFHMKYYLIDPKNIDPEKITNFDWGTRSTEEAFEEVFPQNSIQKTSLTSAHYFDLTLTVEDSILYRQNKVENGKMQWEIEQYIDSDFLITADRSLQDSEGKMKDYNLKVRLYSENPYADNEINEEACILLDGQDIPVNLESFEENGKMRYNHRFSLRNKLPHACEGEAKPMHFDEEYRYYIRASLQRKVEGAVDVYLRSGYHDIAVKKQGKIYRRLINQAYDYEDELIYIHPIDANEDVFDAQGYIDFYKKQQEQAVSYMGYVYDVPRGDNPNDYAILEDEKIIPSDGKTSYLIFYPHQTLMYLNQENNFLSFHFPYLYRDADQNYYAKALTDNKITNPYFVISNDDTKDRPMHKVSVRMLDFKNTKGDIVDGFSLQLEMEIFGIRNWLFDNMDRGDSEAERTSFYELVLDQVGESKEVQIENSEVLKEHFNVIAIIARDDYYEEGVENPEGPSGCPQHEKTSLSYRHQKALKSNEKYKTELEWLIEYSQLEIEGGY